MPAMGKNAVLAKVYPDPTQVNSPCSFEMIVGKTVDTDVYRSDNKAFGVRSQEDRVRSPFGQPEV